MIQRQLQQVEEQQRQLEKRGVMVEKALRGEAGTCLTCSNKVRTFGVNLSKRLTFSARWSQALSD